MSSEMSHLRKEDLSLYYHLKHVVLSKFIEIEERMPLRYMPEMSTETSYVYEAESEMIPCSTERGRGWVYLDEPFDIQEQSNRIILYDLIATVVDEFGNVVIDNDGNTIMDEHLIDDSEYMIDYIDGRVIVSGTCEPTHVTYDWNYVSVVDEWAIIEASDSPVVVIDIHDTNKKGYQFGGGKKINRKVDIHIFASSASERNDLVDTIYDGLYLKSCPLYDFPNGTILDFDGTFYGRKDNMNKAETPFDRTTISGVSRLQFENITARNVKLPLLLNRSKNETILSDLNAYRSKISFEMVSYTNV